jgi:hypothetical protein
VTFLGIRCEGNSAEIVVDSAAYTDAGAKFVEVTKVATFPHLDAAFACSGHGKFSYWAHRCADDATVVARDFDDLVDAAPIWLARALEASGEDPQAPSGLEVSATAFLVGYSARESRYVAYMATMQSLQPQRIEGLHVQPMPFSRRPGREEREGYREILEDEGHPAEDITELLEIWGSRPAPAISDAADWIELARAARTERSLAGDFLRVWVGGSLYITRMKRGSVRTNRLHTFNDTGDELRQLVTASHHPVAQISACGECESGLPALDCCLREELGDPCDCRSGKAFGDCCVVTDREAVADQLWTGHAVPKVSNKGAAAVKTVPR